jgi:hypothetical protein
MTILFVLAAISALSVIVVPIARLARGRKQDALPPARVVRDDERPS